MLKLELYSLLRHLKERHKPEIRSETQQLLIPLEIGEATVPLFLNILHENLVQLIAYLPYSLQPEHLGDVSRLLHSFNKQLDMPGFGMDEENLFLFYRIVIPCIDKELREEILDGYVNTAIIACRTFLEGVAAAAASSNPVVQEAQKMAHAVRNTPLGALKK